MLAVTIRRISYGYDESAGVCCDFFHNTTVGGNLANKKARVTARSPHKATPASVFSFQAKISFLS